MYVGGDVMAIESTDSSSVEGTINQSMGLKNQSLRNKIGHSLQKKNSVVQINVNRNMLENKANPNKGSKVNLFA